MAKEKTISIDIPEGIQIDTQGYTVKAKGPKGEISRELRNKTVRITKEGNTVKITSTAKKNSRKERTTTGTFEAHVNNMIKGVKEGITYRLKICASHFPMNVTANNGEFSVKNFLGEKIPRTFKITEGVEVKVNGQDVTVEGTDIEKVGMTAAKIEQLTRITDKDRRIFQDGIYMTEKNGKEV